MLRFDFFGGAVCNSTPGFDAIPPIKTADLRNVRTRGDVGEIGFLFRIKRIASRPVVQLGINLGKIPRIFQLHRYEIDGGVRRYVLNIGFYMIRQFAVFLRIKTAPYGQDGNPDAGSWRRSAATSTNALDRNRCLIPCRES